MGRVAVVTGGASGIGLAINTIPPRAVITPMFMAAPFAQGPGGEENMRQLAARSAVRRLGVPEDIAHRSAERNYRPTSQSKLLIGYPTPC